MADRSLLLSKNRPDDWSIVGCIRLSCLNFWTNLCLPEFLRSRAAPTPPKAEKPRKAREGKRSKRLKRQQPERKGKYRERQCRANREQHRKLSKPSARHDMQLVVEQVMLLRHGPLHERMYAGLTPHAPP
jgi:hypothetical protein